MKTQTPKNERMDFEQLFKELYAQSEDINPSLLGDMESFNDSQVSLQNFHSYVYSLNQTPILTTSNSVTQ